MSEWSYHKIVWSYCLMNSILFSVMDGQLIHLACLPQWPTFWNGLVLTICWFKELIILWRNIWQKKKALNLCGGNIGVRLKSWFGILGTVLILQIYVYRSRFHNRYAYTYDAFLQLWRSSYMWSRSQNMLSIWLH